MSILSRSRIVTALLPLAVAASAAAQAPGYHVVKRVEVGGEGGWDYLSVDTAAHRAYLSRGTHVMVYDTDRDSVVGDIPDTPGVHGIAIARALGRGFTSNGRDSTVTIFDLGTLAVIARVKVTGRNPDAILYEPVSGRVFTFNGGSANATALDARTGAVVGTLALGGKPEFPTTDGSGRVFVNIEDRSQIVAFDARTLAASAPWSLAPCEEPSGMAIDGAHHRLFAVCSNKLMAVVDAANGHVVTTLPIGAGVDGAGFDPGTGNAFASAGGDGVITVVHEDTPDRYHVAETVATQRGARTMAVDERTHKLYTVTARFGDAPAPTADRPRPRPPMLPGSFTVLVVGRE